MHQKSGLGAALIQNNHPILLASKAFDKTQQSYAVIEKELLAICFGCNKFHEYIFGKEVTIETDHKPLVNIMTKPLHSLTARVQRMRMHLQNYNLQVKYVKGSQMYISPMHCPERIQIKLHQIIYLTNKFPLQQ